MNNKYYCGANTRIYITQNLMRGRIDPKMTGGLNWVSARLDEAVAINFTIEQAKEPLYSYASPEFSTVADGKVIVVGKLITNISDKSKSNYIAKTLRSLDPKYLQNRVDVPGSETIDPKTRVVPQPLPDTNIEAIKTKIANGVPLNQQELDYYSFWMLTNNHNKVNPVASGPYNGNALFADIRSDQHNLGFDLEVRIYGNDEMNPTETKVIKDVTIKSMTYMKSPTAEPLAEVYEFIARKVIYK